MQCPRCGSEKHLKYRSPKEQDEVTLRRHECQACGRVFLSAQVVVTEDLEEELLNLFEQ